MALRHVFPVQTNNTFVTLFHPHHKLRGVSAANPICFVVNRFQKRNPGAETPQSRPPAPRKAHGLGANFFLGGGRRNRAPPRQIQYGICPERICPEPGKFSGKFSGKFIAA
jgi:hypothetical protein